MAETSSRTQDESAPLLADALGNIHALALQLARQHGLLKGDELYCWGCGVVGALIPSLHCADCLSEARQRDTAEREEERKAHPETHRWNAINRVMTEDGRFDAESAKKLIKNAEELPSATDERKRELWRRYDERFGSQQQRKPSKQYGRGFAKRSEPDQWEGTFEDRF